MAQTVCVFLDDTTKSALSAIAKDRFSPLKPIPRARIVLLSSEQLNVQNVVPQAGVNQPAVQRWQQRFAEEGIGGLAAQQDPPTRHPIVFHPHSGGGAGADLFVAAQRNRSLDRPRCCYANLQLTSLRAADMARASPATASGAYLQALAQPGLRRTGEGCA